MNALFPIPEAAEAIPEAGALPVGQLPASNLAAILAEQKRVGPVITPKAAASAIGVSRQRVYQFLKEGRLQRLNRLRSLIPVSSLQQFLAVPRGCGLRWQQGDLFAAEETHHE